MQFCHGTSWTAAQGWSPHASGSHVGIPILFQNMAMIREELALYEANRPEEEEERV
jgi:hypothetical protein